jgi:hypothetical protein
MPTIFSVIFHFESQAVNRLHKQTFSGRHRYYLENFFRIMSSRGRPMTETLCGQHYMIVLAAVNESASLLCLRRSWACLCFRPTACKGSCTVCLIRDGAASCARSIPSPAGRGCRSRPPGPPTTWSTGAPGGGWRPHAWRGCRRGHAGLAGC